MSAEKMVSDRALVECQGQEMRSQWRSEGQAGCTVPENSVLTLCRSAGQELLTVMVGVAIPAVLYTSRRFADTGSCRRHTYTHKQTHTRTQKHALLKRSVQRASRR